MKLSWTLVALCAATVDAQQPSPVERIALAEQALADADAETAAEQLRLALSDLESTQSETLRRQLERTIRELLAKADPHAEASAKAATAAAQRLLQLAEAYRKRGLLLVALDLTERARRFDAALAAKLHEALLKQLGPRAPAPAKATETAAQPATAKVDRLFEYFEDGVQPYAQAGRWVITKEHAKCPPVKRMTTMVVSKQVVDGDFEVGVEADLGQRHGVAALVFGAIGTERYFVLSAEFWPGESAFEGLVLYEFDGQAVKALGSLPIELSTIEATGTHRFRARIRGRKVMAIYGDAEPQPSRSFEIELPRSASGSLGLFVSGNSPNQEPITFRRFHVEKL